MSKLFQVKAAHLKRTIRYPILLTEAEAGKIKELAGLRNLSVAEFIRRAALGKKAKVHPETDLVIAVSQATYAIREVHAYNKAAGITNDEGRMARALEAATEAIIAVTDAQ